MQKSGKLSHDEICQMIESAANGEALPFEFLARLIWQESKFNPQAVSRVGAQGIAQFMPKVASGRGLADPFEPQAALQESAEFLRELRDRFGNLGLAAAAYNAGPGRVERWLARKSALPRETRNYVHIITGYRPEKWVASAPPPVEEAANFTSEQCNGIAKLAVDRQKLGTLERFANIVSERLNKKVRLEASVTTSPRGSGRKGILAKRGAQVASTRIEQVTRVVAQSGKRARVEKIIRIVAQRSPGKGSNARVAARASEETNGGNRRTKVARLGKGRAAPEAGGRKVAKVASGRMRIAANSGRRG